jgi:acyl-CoA thioesterase-1
MDHAMYTILAFGNSLTAGFGVPEDKSFAAGLDRALQQEGFSARVINGGVSGDTTFEALRRLEGLLRYEPDLVLVELGANDLLMGLPANTVRANLERLVDTCLDTGANVLLAGVLSLQGMDEDHTKRFHAAYADLAQSRNITLVPDFLPDIPGDPELTLPDGLHPNEAGIEQIVRTVLPYLRPFLVASSEKSS